MLVSSANKINLSSFETLQISLIYIINSFGPRTDPCGTPHVILRRLDYYFIEFFLKHKLCSRGAFQRCFFFKYMFLSQPRPFSKMSKSCEHRYTFCCYFIIVVVIFFRICKSNIFSFTFI